MVRLAMYCIPDLKASLLAQDTKYDKDIMNDLYEVMDFSVIC